jgi:hypothetical protein
MPGNYDLRRALDDASAMRVAPEYRARLEQLRQRYHHNIRILDDGGGRLERFNCFAYAVGVWQGTRYERLVDQTQSSVLINSAFVADMLARGKLTEVQRREVRSDDIVLYFSGRELKHAGRIVSTSPGLTVHSKWGGNEVHAHPLWELPGEHGGKVRFFRPADPAPILARLEEANFGTERAEKG